MIVSEQREAMIARFFAAHAGTLERRVARRVRGVGPAVIEDACQTAWLTLVRRPDVPLDEGGLAWLSTVAVHEAWRLAGRARDIPAGCLHPSVGVADGPCRLVEPGGGRVDPSERVLAVEDHHERVEDLLQLKPREREALYLQALGYSYREIAAKTGATYTAVSRRISEGRAKLRALGGEREAATQEGRPGPC